MPQCPKCGTDLKDDYGMVTCAGCGSIAFVDLEGNAIIGEEAGDPSSPLSEPIDAVDIRPSADEASTDLQNDFLSPVELPEASQAEFSEPPSSEFLGEDAAPAFGVDVSAAESAPESVPNADPGEFDFHPESFQAVEPMEFPGEGLPAQASEEKASEVESMGSDEEFNMDALLGYSAAEDQGSAPAMESSNVNQDFGPANDPLGLNEYANSEISQGRDGLLVFRIFISGIDSKEMRDSIREALEDSRFGWSSIEMMSQISKGELTIENVPPAKASILVSRIKHLSVKIRWEQYAITQMDDMPT